MKLLDDYIKQLSKLQAVEFQEYSDNYLIHRTVERLLEISIQACLDIGRHLIAKEGFRFPEENKDVFRVLREENMIPQGLLTQLEDMAGFRNILVHEYAEIEQRQVYDNLQDNLDDFVKFARAINDYLDRSSESGDADSGTKNRTARESSARYTTHKRKPAKRHAR